MTIYSSLEAVNVRKKNMGLHNELPIYKACCDLLIEIFEFSKEYKCIVGERLKKETIDLLTLIYRANSQKDKRGVLQEAKERYRGNSII